MTRIEIATLAVKALELNNRFHIDVMEIIRGMKMSTDEAVTLNGEWKTLRTSGDWDRWDVARTVANSYARNVSFR